MIHHITFTDENMTISAEACRGSAKQFGCDRSTIYTAESIKNLPGYKLMAHVLSEPRGAGYWAWKPLIMLHHIETKVKENEYLVYTDAGVEFIDSVQHLIGEMRGDVMVFGNRWAHTDWCKGDVLDYFGTPRTYMGEQLQASCIIIRNCWFARHFIQSWFNLCKVKEMIDDSPSISPNSETFREHRHDQALLTELAIGNALHFYWWPTVYNRRHKHNYTMSDYPIIFNHHRKRNNEW